MLKLLKWVIGSVIVLVALAVGIGFLLPSEYELERSVTINAPAAVIHTYVNDLRRWDDWSPWREQDPTIVTTVGSVSSGVGASQSWDGDSGDGALTITSSSPDKGVDYDLEFYEGSVRAKAGLTYTAQDQRTVVTWYMRGDAGNDIMGRYFGLAIDSMVGPMFESGLTKLKHLAETN